MSAATPPSPSLEASNRLLLERRAAFRVGKAKPSQSERRGDTHLSGSAGAKSERVADEGHPDTATWHSQPLAQHLHQIKVREQQAAAQVELEAWIKGRPWMVAEKRAHPDEAPSAPATRDPGLALAPDIAAALLRHNLAGAGRIWLLLRHLDADGRGWISVEEARAHLSTKGAPLRVCGWRQLRNLLRDGQGILWYRDDSLRNEARIWLRKPAKVALALSVERVSGHSVKVPVEDLLGGVGEARAQLYAAFHSGRAKEALHQGRPISRETIARLTGVPRRTQLEYEARAGIKVRHNYAVGEQATTAGMQERAWQHGGTFRFVDSQGKQGKKGGEYVAWQMPNSYAGPHQQHSKSRNRRINHDLADLREYGGAGNGQERVEKLYFEHGAAAGKAYNRDSSRDAYWPFDQGSVGSGIWYVLSR